MTTTMPDRTSPLLPWLRRLVEHASPTGRVDMTELGKGSQEERRQVVRRLEAEGWVTYDEHCFAVVPVVQLTFTAWDVFDDANPGAGGTDLRGKLAAYADASERTNVLLGPVEPIQAGAPFPLIDEACGEALDAEDVARHRYEHALARHRQRPGPA